MIENSIKIIRWANGNVIWQIQNNGLTFHFLLEIMSQFIVLQWLISIMQPKAKENLDVVNEL
jgi:hypothetical protein